MLNSIQSPPKKTPNRRMVFKYPGAEYMHGDFFDYLIINESDTQLAVSLGWELTTDSAKSKHDNGNSVIEDSSENKPFEVKRRGRPKSK